MNVVYQITPPNSLPYVIVGGIALLLIVLLLLFFTISISIRRVRYVITDKELTVNSLFYGNKIEKSVVDTQNIRVVNLKVERNLSPKIRTNGIGLPGFLCGWFKLKNGEKALLFITQQENVIYVPTQDFSLLLSVPEPEKFREVLIEGWQ